MRPIYNTIILLLVIGFGACKAPQKTICFVDNTPLDQSVEVQKIDRFKETIVQSDDILAINLTTPSSIIDEKQAKIFNEGGTPYSTTAMMGGGAAPASSANGYLVDPQGYIDFPVLGKLKVGSLTIRQIKEMMEDKLKNYVKDPVVEARIINYKVTVMGEVNHPGFVLAPNQKINVVDAIAAAGDIPITGRRDNILIIRETEGTREFAHLNLNSKNVFSSPYYYLKQNDIVYVEPARIKRQENNDFLKFYLPAISALLTTILAVYGIVQITK
jgi:polysaccharide export outer membrane protein